MKRLFVVLFLLVILLTPAFGAFGAAANDLDEKQKTAKIEGEFLVTVDYSKTLEQMIEAGGYDKWNADVNSNNFPISEQKRGIEKIKIEFVNFDLESDTRMDSDEVLRLLDKIGFRPVTLPELIALGTDYREKQKFDVVALGSTWNDDVGDIGFVAICPHNKEGRTLGVLWSIQGWTSDYRFAAVRLSSPQAVRK